MQHTANGYRDLTQTVSPSCRSCAAARPKR